VTVQFDYVISVQAVVYLDLRTKVAHYDEVIFALGTGYSNWAQRAARNVSTGMLLVLFDISLCKVLHDSRMPATHI